MLQGNEATRAQVPLFMFLKDFFKSCIPYFPGEDKLPNTGTWEPEKSLGLWSLTPRSQKKHTQTDADDSATRCPIVTEDSQMSMVIAMYRGETNC